MHRLQTLALAIVLSGATVASVGAQPRATDTAVLGFDELEQIVIAEGITPTKLEARDLLLKVEGLDADGRKVKLYLDRRSGDVLSRELKLGKHERGSYGNGATAPRVR